MATRTQEKALKVYYAAMPDEELENAAANKSSFLPLAQKLLSEELCRRHLPQELTLRSHPSETHRSLRGRPHASQH